MKKPKVVEGHSINPANNPPFSEQWREGIDFRGNERAGANATLDFEDEGIAIFIGQHYWDDLAGIEVVPVRFYSDKVEISDGRSCTLEYALTHWEEYVRSGND